MRTGLSHIQHRAYKLARSGEFIGWRPIAFELSFEPGYKEALPWLSNVDTQDELDRLCANARRRARREAA